MASQYTSNGTKNLLSVNRDPRYMHPIFTYNDESNDSIISNCNLPNLKITCKQCTKYFNTLKGLRLHTSRIHPNNIIPTTTNCDDSSLLNDSTMRRSPLENAFESLDSFSIDHNNVWYQIWKKICTLNGKQYDLHNGNVPKTFIQILAKEIETLSKNEFPSERLIIFISVILQRNKNGEASQRYTIKSKIETLGR